MKYPILKREIADMNFNRDQIVGLKKFTVGSGTNQISIVGGKMWGGGNSFDTGIFQLDLGESTLSITGTVNATAGIFSGDITLSGTLTAGADDESKIVLDGANKKLSFYNDSGTVAATLYNYVVSGGSSKSVGLDAASSSGEVKLSLGTVTGLVIKRINGYPGIELWGRQQIDASNSDLIQISKAICPTSDGGASSGTSAKQWDRVHSKNGYNCDGDSGWDGEVVVSGGGTREVKGGIIV